MQIDDTAPEAITNPDRGRRHFDPGVRYLEKELTLVTVPNAGHWVHLDAPELVTRRLVAWLTEE